ncbi:MurR/RpiR family transcriptional regulator [Propioniciclava coleopterorum]|uniref:MurR/RpiR family transcriptional regulator n=1 Tax=Propioniciclava coleopterorum TaxID=2714937 RepID=A0A6G7Y9K4_9ACTN|nr:MurR/RpiR family transcriptional regulator [Propioniciclava coleopterorum]QIK73399.1 MurR/RpiR family transcriptional regulator [Propioniciclava coleopterorum]
MDVLGTLSAARPRLRPAELRVAVAILEDPETAAGATVAALAEQAQVSQASVVRLAHALGYSGFPELRVTLTQELARRAMELERSAVGHGRIDVADDLSEVVAKLAFHEARSIEQTARLIDPDALDAVSAAIADGRPTLTLGVGASGLAAMDMTSKLQRIGLASVFSPDTHLQLTHAALTSPESVVIAFSFSGRTGEVHRALSLARERRALTVAVTGDPLSPIGALADHVLTISAREDELRAAALASRMAQLAVVDFLFVLVAQRRGSGLDDILEQTRAAVRDLRMD